MLVKIFRADRVPGHVYDEKIVRSLDGKWKSEQSGDIRLMLAEMGLALVGLNVSARDPGVMLVTARAFGGSSERRKPISRAGRPVEVTDGRRKASAKRRAMS